MTETMILIAATEARSAVEDHAGEPLEVRVRAAMERTWRHWLATDEEEQFKAAVVAVLESATDDEKASLEAELMALRDLSALMSGVPVDMERMASGIEAGPPKVGLLKLWGSVKADKP